MEILKVTGAEITVLKMEKRRWIYSLHPLVLLRFNFNGYKMPVIDGYEATKTIACQ